MVVFTVHRLLAGLLGSSYFHSGKLSWARPPLWLHRGSLRALGTFYCRPGYTIYVVDSSQWVLRDIASRVGRLFFALPPLG